MVKKYVLFSSPLFLEYLLPIFLEENITIPIFTNKTEIHRKYSKSRRENYAPFFDIKEVSGKHFSEVKDKIDIPKDKIAIFIDWNKDFFDEIPHFFTTFCQPALLPMYRGYGAITEQFLKGVAVSGITFYLPSQITDSGDIIYQKEIRIDFEDYPEDFILKVCREIVNTIKEEDLSKKAPVPQKDNFSFSLSRLRKRNAIIDFRADALSVYNHIRGFSRPFFGAFCFFEDNEITVWRGRPEKWQGIYGNPGEVLDVTDNGIEVACGSGTVVLTEIEGFSQIKKSSLLNNYLKVD